MKKENRINAKTENKNIIITIPIKTLVCAFNHNPDNEGSFKVKQKDSQQFAEDFAKYINEYESQNSQEDGITAFGELCDDIGRVMCEDAVESITYTDKGERKCPF